MLHATWLPLTNLVNWLGCAILALLTFIASDARADASSCPTVGAAYHDGFEAGRKHKACIERLDDLCSGLKLTLSGEANAKTCRMNKVKTVLECQSRDDGPSGSCYRASKAFLCGERSGDDPSGHRKSLASCGISIEEDAADHPAESSGSTLGQHWKN